MEETNFPKEILKDPLSAETRKERRNLLFVSAMGLTMVYTGLVPTKISALGVEFDKTDQDVILRVLAAVIFYFLMAFIFYALSDFWSFRIETYFKMQTYYKEEIKANEEIINDYQLLIAGKTELTAEATPLIDEAKKIIESMKEIRSEVEPYTSSTEKTKMIIALSLLKQAHLQFQSQSEKLNDVGSRIKTKNADAKKLEQLVSHKEVSTKARDDLKKGGVAIATLRLSFEFAVPLIISVWAMIILLRR